jgi:stage V sporulation protein K
MPRNALQELLASRAISLAKSLGHGAAEEGHVRVVIAETVLDPDIRYERGLELRAVLPPAGNSIKLPELAQSAEQLIELCVDEDAAEAALGPANRPESGPFAVKDDRQTEQRHSVSVSDSTRTPSDLMKDLDALVGLTAVKQQLRKVISVVEANRVRTTAGDQAVPQSLHLVFTGNPGTGKTTVARLVAELYGATGALKGTKFKEATRADLIAQYVGHTAQQTERVIRSVKPGVLFIDEAYSLTPSHHGDFAEEFVATMVKSMEDYRSEFAVIAAGYKEEMKTFVNSNPGLRSRFQTFIHFEDYTASELLEIYRRFANESNILLGDGVEERAITAIELARGHEGFGNARFVRSLWEESFANMAVRAAEDGLTTREELRRIESADVPVDGSPTIGQTRRIGFQPKEG